VHPGYNRDWYGRGLLGAEVKGVKEAEGVSVSLADGRADSLAAGREDQVVKAWRTGGGSKRRGVLNFEVYRVPKSFGFEVPERSGEEEEDNEQAGRWVVVVGGEGRTTHRRSSRG